MNELNKNLGRWLACALTGALIAYLYAVLRAEPVAHEASMSAWQWFWQSYGAYFSRGLLLGGVAGLVLVFGVPRVLAGQRRA